MGKGSGRVAQEGGTYIYTYGCTKKLTQPCKAIFLLLKTKKKGKESHCTIPHASFEDHSA